VSLIFYACLLHGCSSKFCFVDFKMSCEEMKNLHHTERPCDVFFFKKKKLCKYICVLWLSLYWIVREFSLTVVFCCSFKKFLVIHLNLPSTIYSILSKKCGFSSRILWFEFIWSCLKHCDLKFVDFRKFCKLFQFFGGINCGRVVVYNIPLLKILVIWAIELLV